MNRENNEKSKKLLAVLAVVLFMALMGHTITVTTFNQRLHSVHGADDTQPSYLRLGNREDSTSSWLKRDFELNGERVDLCAQTFDGTFFNRAGDAISDWSMTLHIQGDCFLNNAWCGEVEIHQYTGTPREAVQTLDLRDYRLEDVELDYRYDGDLLIPLQKGDYVVYHPSEKDRELPIASHSELTMGMIVYYLDQVDLTDYDLSYRYHRVFHQGFGFYAALGLLLVWLAVFLSVQVAQRSYRRAWKEMEQRKTGISYMSELYDIIYIIDLTRDELEPVYEDEDAQEHRLKEVGAREQLQSLLTQTATEPYRPLMETFVDLRTLSERMERSSIVCEYRSRPHGWCQARFFAMDRSEGEPLRRVLFTIQNINDEKLEMEQVEERISRSRNRRRLKQGVYDSISRRMTEPVLHMRSLSRSIQSLTSRDTVMRCAREIDRESSELLSYYQKVELASRLSAGLLEPSPAPYALRALLEQTRESVRAAVTGKGLRLAVDLTAGIPNRLIGDGEKLQRILSYLLRNAVKYTDRGTITLSVFGKTVGEREHLLFSVRDTGVGMPEELSRRLRESWQPEGESEEAPDYALGLSLVNGLLELLESQLCLISAPGEGSEFYFELDQTIEDPAPIGALELGLEPEES